MVDSQRKLLAPEVRRGSEAHALLGDPVFLQQWQSLEQRCPWGTVYQSPAFAGTWYDTYREVYDPVLVFARNESELQGLFLLAQSPEGKGLIHVGGVHAEYQAWLATPDRSNAFLAGAAVVLRELGAHSLRLHFAAPELPLNHLDSVPGSVLRTHVLMHRRGLMAVDENSTARASLRKKGNRSKLSRLRRQGDVSLVQLESGAELREVLDRIVKFCDLRQGAVHDSTPFQSDPLKRKLYLELMDQPGLMHATVLMAGSEPVAAHLGLVDRDYVSLGLITHSPFAASHSPAKLLMLMLAERLGQQGYREFDLTPGGDYKLRFASREDEIASLDLFFSSSRYRRRQLRQLTANTVKTALHTLGIDSRSVADKRAGQLAQAARHPYRAASATVRRCARWVRHEGEFRIYRMTSESAQELELGSTSLRVNAIEDLLRYAPASENDATKSRFLSKALRRLEMGQIAFTHVEKGLLLHYSWLITRTREAGSEFGHRYAFAEPAALLWNGYTHPAARGRGLHQASIRQRARYVATHQLAPNIVTGVRSDNGPSRHNIEKLGFEYVGSAWMKRRFGKSERWLTGPFLESRDD